MTFEPGNKYGKGRPKGAKDKRSKSVEYLAEKLNCNPIEILMHFAKGDWKALGYESGTKMVYLEKGRAIEEDIIGPRERIQAAKEVAQYLYPKRKSIEVNTNVNLELAQKASEYAELPKERLVEELEAEVKRLKGG